MLIRTQAFTQRELFQRGLDKLGKYPLVGEKAAWKGWDQTQAWVPCQHHVTWIRLLHAGPRHTPRSPQRCNWIGTWIERTTSSPALLSECCQVSVCAIRAFFWRVFCHCCSIFFTLFLGTQSQPALLPSHPNARSSQERTEWLDCSLTGKSTVSNALDKPAVTSFTVSNSEGPQKISQSPCDSLGLQLPTSTNNTPLVLV